MKLNSIIALKSFPSTISVNKNAFQKAYSREDSASSESQKIYASHLTFKGGVNPALLSKYKLLIETQKETPIEAFLSLNASKEEMEELALTILNNDNLSFEFIKSLTEFPRKVKHFYSGFQSKLDRNSVFFNIYFPTNKYKLAYEKYINKRVENTQSISELLKIRPDWKEDFLLQKHRELYHNDNFELGFVPEHIGAENFSQIMNYLSGYKDYGFKTKQVIPNLTVNGRTFKFEKLIDGRSDKNVFLITSQDGKKYVIKTADAEQRGLNKPFAIGTCCIIDQYLTMNNCRNSAPLRYYNHDANTAIYDFIEHETTSKINTLSGFVDYMPDFSDLGLYHSDTVGTNNYFKLSKNQNAMKNSYDFDYGVAHEELVSVDNDHVTFNLAMSPMVDKYHKYLPTGMQMFN